jgi:hypothetical protein
MIKATMIPTTLRNSILAAAGALALALPLSAPAQADPPWRHDASPNWGPPGWSRHHDRPPRHGWRDWDDRPVIRHRRGPAYYVYEYDRPRVLYLPPPPVVYLPPRSAGVDIHLPLPLP